jgi:uncharacterized protein
MLKKPRIILFIMLVLAFLFSSSYVFALDQLTGFVNDEAGVISPEYKQILNDELYNLKLNTSVEMAVATVTSLNGTPIEEYSLNLAHKTLGEKGKDNGVLVLLAVDNREYRIEVGYGLEPVLNAALLGRIGRNIMEPSFKQGNYEQGLLDGVKVISAILRNDTSYETQGTGQSNGLSQQIVPPLIIIGVMFLIFILPIALGIIAAYKAAKKKMKKDGKDDKHNDNDFLAALILASMFGRGGGRGGSGGSGGFGGGGGGFGGFGGGSFGGGGFSGKF